MQEPKEHIGITFAKKLSAKTLLKNTYQLRIQNFKKLLFFGIFI